MCKFLCSDGHYYAGDNTSQTLVSVPPAAPPPPSVSVNSTAKSGDAVLWRPCDSALASAQRWKLRSSGQLALWSTTTGAGPKHRIELCATVSREQLQLSPCSTARDHFTFRDGNLTVLYPDNHEDPEMAGTQSMNSSCVVGNRADGKLFLSGSTCAAAATAAIRSEKQQLQLQLWYDDGAQGYSYVHADGYCVTAATNHSHGPSSPVPPPPPIELFFRGRYNVEGIIGTLAEDENLGAATDVVIGGCSSGGVAVFSNADHLHHVLTDRLSPTTRIASIANSGYYLNVNTEPWVKPPLLMANLTSTLPQRCVHSTQWRDRPWFCVVAEVAAPFIEQMPVFAWQSQFDANQLGWSCSECGSNQDNISAVEAYGKRMRASIAAWLGVTSSTSIGHGAYVDSCHRHNKMPLTYFLQLPSSH